MTTQYVFRNVPLKMPQATQVRDSFQSSDPFYFMSQSFGNGCVAYYRIKFINEAIRMQHENAFFIDGEYSLLPFPEVTQCIRSYRTQRLSKPNNIPMFQQLAELRNRFQFKLIYDIDDLLISEDMPQNHIAKNFFADSIPCIKFCMDNADIISVTNHQLRDYYSAKLSIPPEKFRIIPNYLLQMWGDTFIQGAAAEKYRKHRDRLRIGFCLSPSHYAQHPGQEDDISTLLPWIIANRRKYQFVFMNGISPELRQYSDVLEIVPGSSFLNYPREIHRYDLDLMIAPLADNLFNRCKSDIKIQEGWAFGIPVLASSVVPSYMKLAPECSFRDSADLDRLISDLFQSPEHLQQVVDANHAKMDGLWIHRHIGEWSEIMV